jgi:hypothetical protein
MPPEDDARSRTKCPHLGGGDLAVVQGVTMASLDAGNVML